MGPCDCGDLYCGSCGPLQGNTKCYGCGEWAMDHDEPGSRHDEARCAAIEDTMFAEEAETDG